MSAEDGAGPDSKAGLKVGLKRVALEERVLGDDELKGCELVRLLGPTAAKFVLQGSVAKRFADGARVFIEGDPGDALVLLMKGEARLWVGAGKTTVEVGGVRKGEFIGEREALGDDGKRAYSAQAVGELEIIEIPSAIVRQCAGKFPLLEGHLRQVAAARKEAGAAMVDFFNRW